MYISNKEMLTGPHAVNWFDIAGVETFSSGGQTTYYSLQISVILQEMRSAWWHPALLMNECLVSMDHAVNSRRANLQGFLSERHTFLQQRSEKEAMKFG